MRFIALELRSPSCHRQTMEYAKWRMEGPRSQFDIPYIPLVCDPSSLCGGPATPCASKIIVLGYIAVVQSDAYLVEGEQTIRVVCCEQPWKSSTLAEFQFRTLEQKRNRVSWSRVSNLISDIRGANLLCQKLF